MPPGGPLPRSGFFRFGWQWVAMVSEWVAVVQSWVVMGQKAKFLSWQRLELGVHGYAWENRFISHNIDYPPNQNWAVMGLAWCIGGKIITKRAFGYVRAIDWQSTGKVWIIDA